jgi:D-threo-aldose 1-dehydrogenase
VRSVLVGIRSAAEAAEAARLAQVPIPAALWGDLQDQGLLRPDVPVPT